MNGGVTVREMAAAYTYLGNGGLYYEPYTYYYVTDSEDNIIIDNRDAVPKQAYSAETAGIMNRLLHYNVTNSAHTNAHYAQISGWDIIGKTGTTDDDKDSWFCGCSPYAVMATWCGLISLKPFPTAEEQRQQNSLQMLWASTLKAKKTRNIRYPIT